MATTETITFETAADATNAESQKLAVVRYHQVVSREQTMRDEASSLEFRHTVTVKGDQMHTDENDLVRAR